MEEAKNPLINNNTTSIECEFCQADFKSRNLFFRHLRDPLTPCGGAHKADRLPEAPSATKRLAKQRQRHEASSRRPRNFERKQQDQEYCVWVGDIPLPWTRHGKQHQRLRALLGALCGGVSPWIQHVQRKAYRHKETRAYLGYCVVALRDEEECTAIIQALNGKECRNVLGARETSSSADLGELAALQESSPPFVLRARRYEQRNQNENSTTEQQQLDDGDTSSNPDPPLRDQLVPLSTQELLQRIAYVSGEDDTLLLQQKPDITHSQALNAVVEAYATHGDPRRHVPVKGRPLPVHLQERLLHILQTLRWSVPNHRRRVAADRYLVLWTKVIDDEFIDLRQACRALMEWAAPNFYYSAIAVTKNFVGSPHTDERDQTVQYAVSLGDFTSGGELCVDGMDATDNTPVVYVVTTHNRIGCVDGRHVHWVRPWTGGNDRYSLIFYDTSDKHPTAVHPQGVIIPTDDDE